MYLLLVIKRSPVFLEDEAGLDIGIEGLAHRQSGKIL